MPKKSYVIQVKNIEKIFNKARDKSNSEIDKEDHDSLINFFGQELIEKICHRYGMEFESVPRDMSELALLTLGIATNLTSTDIQKLEDKFISRPDLQKFLTNNLWWLQDDEVDILKKRATNAGNKLIKNVRKASGKLASERIKSCMKVDFQSDDARYYSILNAHYTANMMKTKVNNNFMHFSELTDFTRNELTENNKKIEFEEKKHLEIKLKNESKREAKYKVESKSGPMFPELNVPESHFDSPSPKSNQTSGKGKDRQANPLQRDLQKSIQSEYISKGFAYSGNSTEDIVPKNQVLPIPNEEGEIELYQIKKYVNQNGLCYNILAIIPPKQYPNSHDVLLVFRGTVFNSIGRNFNFSNKETTPGRTLLMQNSMQILEEVGDSLLDLKREDPFAFDNYKLKILGHSLGAADAQNVLIEAIHLRAAMAQPALLEEVQTNNIVRERVLTTQAKLKNHLLAKNIKRSRSLEEFQSLRIDMGVWGSPGVYSKDNYSTCVLMDKLNIAEDYSMQFSHIHGDPVKKQGTHLGSLASSKGKIGTNEDFRPPGDSFNRSKVEWSNTQYKRWDTHLKKVYSKAIQASDNDRLKLTGTVKKYKNIGAALKTLNDQKNQQDIRKEIKSLNEKTKTKFPKISTNPATVSSSEAITFYHNFAKEKDASSNKKKSRKVMDTTNDDYTPKR